MICYTIKNGSENKKKYKFFIRIFFKTYKFIYLYDRCFMFNDDFKRRDFHISLLFQLDIKSIFSRALFTVFQTFTDIDICVRGLV